MKSDDEILEAGGTQEDIANYAHDVGGACGAVYDGTCDHPTCEFNKNKSETMTNQASDLYELCKKVYELTWWKPTDWQHGIEDGQPLYTSDYLLEKLPGQFGNRGSHSVQCLRLCKSNEGYMAGYIGVDLIWWLESVADTPLLALLKLTIALSEAGELK